MYKNNLKEVASELTLLYAEDDNSAREATVKLFSPYFKSIKAVTNGAEALNEYCERQYDLVITDMAMPKMDGLELIQEIRKINRMQYVMVCSAYDQTMLLIGLLNEGIDGFIIKPIDINNAFKNLIRVCTHIQVWKEISQQQYDDVQKRVI